VSIIFIKILIFIFIFIFIFNYSGPVYAMVLEKLEAIQDLVYLVGPKDVEEAKISYPNWY